MLEERKLNMLGINLQARFSLPQRSVKNNNQDEYSQMPALKALTEDKLILRNKDVSFKANMGQIMEDIRKLSPTTLREILTNIQKGRISSQEHSQIVRNLLGFDNSFFATASMNKMPLQMGDDASTPRSFFRIVDIISSHKTADSKKLLKDIRDNLPVNGGDFGHDYLLKESKKYINNALIQ